jgi:hypothetical protein
MTESSREYQIGDSVLVDMRGALIPGVIDDRDGDRLSVHLAEPWSDESGIPSDSVTVGADQLRPYLEETSTGQQALPAEGKE